MTIIEHMKNIFNPSVKMPNGFVRNPEFDAVFLVESCGYVPEIVHARNGRTYVYFMNDSRDLISLARKMGFQPCPHKSHKYFPAKIIRRARISKDMPRETLDVVNNLITINNDGIKTDRTSLDYLKYIMNYKTK